MVNRLLVTTALEETWDTKKPMLFLGEWCKLYNRKKYWEDLNILIAPYHWDNRELLKSNYYYLNDFYEILLESLSLKLNSIHNVSYSIKYWRIFIGPWLCEFIQILFDRYMMLDITYKNFPIEKVKLIKHIFNDGITLDYNDFNKLKSEDSWNELVFGEIIQHFNKSNIEWINKSIIVDRNIQEKLNQHLIIKFLFSKIKKYLYKLIDILSGLFVNNTEIFLQSTYLPKKFEFLLQLKLRQFPKIWEDKQIPKSEVDTSFRKSIFFNHNPTNDFEFFVQKSIFKFIPICYLEGYKTLQYSVSKLMWPKNPKAIFSSNKFFNDDLFKMWAAEKSNNGAPLILGQHGGCYGVSDFITTEEHEVKIADVYLTWGWNNRFQKNIFPMFNFKIIGKKINWNPNGKLFIVTMEVPRYSYSIYAIPIASQFQYYLNDQFSFINNLSHNLKKEIILRLFPQDYGWDLEQRFKEKYPLINIDNSRIPIFKKIKDIKLYVSTYNATTFLESLSLNVPTIMFWDFRFWEIRQDAKEYYDELIAVGILHNSPESAAKKIEEVWEDIEAWWGSNEIQEIRINFCSRYSKDIDAPLKALINLFGNIKKSSLN